jgi:hypothetical protein
MTLLATRGSVVESMRLTEGLVSLQHPHGFESFDDLLRGFRRGGCALVW